MSKTTFYIQKKYFKNYIERLKQNNESFQLVKTNYTRKILKDDKTIIFNKEGQKDDKILMLISSVRKDAKEHQRQVRAIQKLKENRNIDFYKLYDLPEDNATISKVDITAAYWNLAIKEKIISKNTNNLFERLYENEPREDAKKARLKALGSLATNKEKITYKGTEEIEHEFESMTTKDLYMGICAGVDSLMKEAGKYVPGIFYYYWDCLFMNSKYETEAVNFFHNKGYSATATRDKLETIEVNGKMYIVSTMFDKCYMVRKQESNLVEWIGQRKENGLNVELEPRPKISEFG